MISIFRSNHPITILYLVLLIVISRAGFFWMSDIEKLYSPSLFGLWFTNYLENVAVPDLLLFSLACLFVLIQSLVINATLIKNDLIEGRSYIPAMCFVVITAAMPVHYILNPVLIAFTFVLISFYYLLKIAGKEKTVEPLFFTSLSIGIGSLFYFPVTYFVFVILIASVILKPVKGREWLMVLIGYLLPYYFIGAGYYLMDDLTSYTAFILGALPGEFDALLINLNELLRYSPLLLLFIVGWSAYHLVAKGTVVKIRRLHRVVIIYFIFCMIQIFFVQSGREFYFYLFSLPFSLYIAWYFTIFSKGWLKIIGLIALWTPVIILFFDRLMQ